MPTDKNKLVTKNRKQYLSNRHIYEAMIKLNKTPLCDLLQKPATTKKQNNIVHQVAGIISLANQAIKKGHDIPKVLNKVIISQMSNFITGQTKGIGWTIPILRANGVKMQTLINDPKKMTWFEANSSGFIESIYKGFVDAKALKNGELTFKKMDNKTYRRRKSGTGYQYGFNIGETKNKLIQSDFLIYIQQKMLANANVDTKGDVTVDIDTIKKNLIKNGQWSNIQDLVKYSKKNKYEPNGNRLMF